MGAMAKWVISTLLACAALAVAGCGGDDTSREASGAEAAGSPPLRAEGAAAKLPFGTPAQAARRAKPKLPQGPTTASLIARDLIQGSGEVAETGKILVVRYVGGVYETGRELEWTGNKPVGFLFGGGTWSYGFEEGMAGMRVGGRRTLIFPTTPATLPPGSQLGDTLVYVVDLLAINERPR